MPATVYGLATGINLSSITGDLAIPAGVADICIATRCDFAFACGIWNGTVELLGGIPDGTSQLIKIVVNQDNKIDLFISKVHVNILLSCNDIEVAKGLAEYTGPKFIPPVALLRSLTMEYSEPKEVIGIK